MPNPGKLIESEFGQWVSAGGLSSAAESRCSWRSAVFIHRLHNGLASAALGLFGFQTGRAAPAWGVPTLKCTVPTPEPNHTAHAKTLFMSQPSTNMPVIHGVRIKPTSCGRSCSFVAKAAPAIQIQSTACNAPGTWALNLSFSIDETKLYDFV